jgi:hypothetical protein
VQARISGWDRRELIEKKLHNLCFCRSIDDCHFGYHGRFK